MKPKEKSVDRELMDTNKQLAKDNLELLDDIHRIEQLAMGMHEFLNKIKDRIGVPAEANEEEVMERLNLICSEADLG